MGRAWQVAEQSLGEFFADGCTKLAAAISFYTLFALFPLTILGVAVAGFVLGDASARSDVIDNILDVVPLSEQAGRQDLERVLTQVTEGAGSASIWATVGLVVAASAVMGAVRFALNSVWGVQDRRAPLPGKAFDVVAVMAIGLLLLSSVALTFLVRALGISGVPVEIFVAHVGPALMAFLVFLALLRTVPACPVSVRDVWPGAAVGAVGYALAKLGFVAYLDSVSSLSAVYASLTAVVAFLLFAWLSASLFLFGAEVAYWWPKVRDGHMPAGPPEPFGMKVRRYVRGFLVQDPPPTPSGLRPGGPDSAGHVGRPRHP